MAVRILFLLALLAGGWGTAFADDASALKVECSTLDFTFAPVQGSDEAYCYRYSHSEANGNDGIAEYSAVYEHMFVYQGAEVIRITNGRAVQNVYFTRRPLSGYIKDFDELSDVANWSDDEDYEGYTVARFDATLDHEAAACYGFMAMGGNVIGARGSIVGPGSFMVGYDCQYGTGALSRSLIEHTLSEIR
jgi:hypothetical protein